MYLKKYHIHFTGIGGIGMSGIAELLLNLGYKVSGSDIRSSDITRRLKRLGGIIFEGHSEVQIQGADVVVTSTAVGRENVEVVAAKHASIPVIPRAEMPGKHNAENVAAASLAALAAGGTFEGARSALRKFKGLSHRLEYIDTLNGVDFFDDSKATNVDSVAKALETFEKPVVLIMGGRNKGSKFYVLRDLIDKHTKELIVIGEAKEDIKTEFGDIKPVETATTMENAVFKAYHAAKPGDIVLLSPACASFDMYNNYGQRGKDFCRIVAKLVTVYS